MIELSVSSLRSLTTGLLSHAQWFRNATRRFRGGGTADTDYCVAQFLRHMENWLDLHPGVAPSSMAELGPGQSLGVGVVATIAGVERYVGLDVVQYFDIAAFRGIATKIREALLAARVNGARYPKAQAFLITQLQHVPHVDEVLPKVHYVAPWTSNENLQAASIDLLCSSSVLEHVDDLAGTYRAFRMWLKPGGVLSHWIDFRSHGHSRFWNGHWSWSDSEARFRKGGRAFLLNREPLQTHLDHLALNGFECMKVSRKVMPSGISRGKLAQRYRGMSDEDLETIGASIVAVLRGPAT